MTPSDSFQPWTVYRHFGFGVVEDLTERKCAEEQITLQIEVLQNTEEDLRESETRLQTFSENSPSPTFLKDLQAA